MPQGAHPREIVHLIYRKRPDVSINVRRVASYLYDDLSCGCSRISYRNVRSEFRTIFREPHDFVFHGVDVWVFSIANASPVPQFLKQLMRCEWTSDFQDALGREIDTLADFFC
jgi:hypothetical protein